ncbi:SPOR domain-containing protein [Ampullimonas aquatilis]|uniref:SPOR domain-containing protein n=1 Tax=Ampullimonas aquatilis TaxID=1341549 RepID=UPI003C74D983
MGLLSFLNKNESAEAPSNNSPLFDGAKVPGAERRKRGRRKSDDVSESAGNLMDEDDYRSDPTLALKRRARRRLIGAVVMVLLAVIILPLILDKEPKPKETPVVIQMSGQPDKLPNKSEARPFEEEIIDPPEVISKPISAAKPIDKPIDKPVVKKNEVTAPVKPMNEPVKEVAKSDTHRFVLQTGSYATPDKIKEARGKVEATGLKTFVQVVQTKEGERTRVRVGPFASKDEAEAAQAKLKAAGIVAAMLDLQ